MKLILTFFLVLLTSLSYANQEMSEEQMQQMMQQAQAAQECFAKIDPAKFEALEARGREMESEIQGLCTAGKRDEAMKTAMKYGKEFSSSDDMKEIRKCSELMQGMMANMPMPKPYMPPEVDEDSESEHICDGM